MKIHKKGKFISILSGLLFLTGLIITSTLLTSSDSVVIKEHKKLTTGVFIPQELSFCGEKVPLEYFDVRESLDRELLVNTYWQSQTVLFFKRANRFLPIIDSILEADSIPLDFRYLPIIESGLENATSPSGAKGFWQFLTATGKEYGLEVNTYIDERYNLELATKAACKYLHKAYRKFGNWTLVAASYNMGMTGLNNKLTEQKVNSYYDLYLNSETARYVFRILAIKLIFEDPKKYSFNVDTIDLYNQVPVRKVNIDSTINNLSIFAINQGTNYKILKILNPWITSDMLMNKSKKNYQLLLPLPDGREVSAVNDSLK